MTGKKKTEKRKRERNKRDMVKWLVRHVIGGKKYFCCSQPGEVERFSKRVPLRSVLASSSQLVPMAQTYERQRWTVSD